MRIYIALPFYFIDATVELTDPQFNHIVRVMRKKEGDELTLFNGEGGEYQTEITAINKRSLLVKLVKFNDNNRSSRLNIHLIQSFAKFDKMDFVFQKSN